MEESCDYPWTHRRLASQTPGLLNRVGDRGRTDGQVSLTVEEAAKRLAIGRTKAYELVASGELQSVTIGRCRRVPVEALERFVAKLRQGGGEVTHRPEW